MYEIKLDIAPAPHLLPLLLLLSERHIHALPHERQIGGQESGEAVLDEGEELLLVFFVFVEVVEEDAAHAAGLVAVLDVEVVVAPFFEARVVGAVVLVAGVFDGAVEVDGVFVEEVAGRQVGAAAEPPRIALVIVSRIDGFEVAVVKVDGGCHGVVRVEDHAQAGGEEFEELHVGVEGFVVDAHFLDGRAGEGAVDDGGVDTGFFEDVPVL